MAVLISKFASPLSVSPYALASTYDFRTGTWNGRRVRGSDGRQYWVQRTGPRHNNIGADIPVVRGAPIFAVASGEVLNADTAGSCGNRVRIAHDRAGMYRSKYCHLDSIVVQRGQRVRQKQLIGYVGCTGNCGGNHLHLEIKGPRGLYPDPVAILGAVGTTQLAVYAGITLGIAALGAGVYYAQKR